MKKNISIVLAVIFLFSASGLSWAEESVFPSGKGVVQADDIGQVSLVSLVSASYSPNRKWIIVVTNKDTDNFAIFRKDSPFSSSSGEDSLWLLNLKSKKKKLLFSAKARSFFAKWSPDSTKIYISHNPHTELRFHIEGEEQSKAPQTGKLLSYNVAQGTLEEIQGLTNYHGADFYVDSRGHKIYYVASISLPQKKEKPPETGSDPNNPDAIIYRGHNPYDYYSPSKEYSLNVFDLKSKENTVLLKESYMIRNIIAAPKQQSIYYEVSGYSIPTKQSSKDISRVRRFIIQTGKSEDMYSGDGFIGLYSLSPDEKKLACKVDLHRKIRYWGPTELAIMDVETKQIKVIPLEINFTDGNCIWTKDSRYLYSGVNSAKGKNIVRIDTSDGQLTYLTDSRSSLFQLNDLSSDGTAILYTAVDNKRYELYKAKSDGSRPELLLGVENKPFEDSFLLGNVEVVSWVSEDNIRVAGILTYPVSYERGKKYPLIVTLHGGPSPAFCILNMAQQFFAGQGYAVLQAEYRTSGSYGWETANTHFNGKYGWATGDLMDIESGVEAMVERGIADPDRVGIIGHSHGAYLTNWATAISDKFSAAVSYEGAFNMAVVVDRAANKGEFSGQYVQEELWGGTIEAVEKTWLHSPYRKIYDIKTPVFFVQGEKGIEIEEMLIGWWTLNRKGIPTELVQYKGEEHVLQKPKNFQDFAKRVQKWFGQFLQ